MKSGKIMTMFLAMAMFLAGCTREKVVIPENSGADSKEPVEMTLTASAIEGHSWAVGDKISVFTSAETSKARAFECTEVQGKEASFTGECLKGKSLCAVWPAEAASSLAIDGQQHLVGVNVPQSQSMDEAANIYVAATSGTKLEFQPSLAKATVVLEASAKTISVKAVTIYGMKNESLSGAMSVMAYDGGVASMLPSSQTDENGISVSGSWKVSQPSPVTITFLMASAYLKNGYKVAVTQEDGTISTQSFETPASFSTNKTTVLERFVFEGPKYYIEYTAASIVKVNGFESDFDEESKAGKIYLYETQLPNNFLNGNTDVVTLTIPKFITGLGTMSIRGCAKLESVVFEKGSFCTTFGNQAFQNDAKLTTLTVPASVLSIGTGCFNACTTLKSLYFEEGSMLETISTNMLAGVQSLSEPLYIPATVKNLGAAFNTKFKTPLEIHFLSPEPPTMTDAANPFNTAYLKGIYVPSANVDAYKAAPIWVKYADKIFGE